MLKIELVSSVILPVPPCEVETGRKKPQKSTLLAPYLQQNVLFARIVFCLA